MRNGVAQELGQIESLQVGGTACKTQPLEGLMGSSKRNKAKADPQGQSPKTRAFCLPHEKHMRLLFSFPRRFGVTYQEVRARCQG